MSLLTSLLAGGSGSLRAFSLPPFAPAVAATNWSNLTFAAGDAYGGRITSSGAQNDSITFALPELRAGTWSISLLHNAFTNRGIFTIEVSPDASSWTSIGTVDSYAASAATTRTTLTGVTIPAGTSYVRLTMATKNASSGSYFGALQGMTGVRTGA